jgi:bifunctional DNA-binding transcriptional regulator/antitoxin component of YhaV-PrlF toxin-antitoxin module
MNFQSAMCVYYTKEVQSMPATAMGCDIMNRKIISVSRKRQITIPIQFYNHLGLENEVECSLEDGAIVIRPINRQPGEFSVEILRDLVSQGYSGNELVNRFEAESNNVKKGIARMLEEADSIAAGRKPAANFDDIFKSED